MLEATLPLLSLAPSAVRAKSGGQGPMNESKFETFYRSTAPKLWSYLYRMTSNAATADDLLQKAYFRFIRAETIFATDEHMRRFLYRTATNLAFDHFRESKRERSREAPDPPSIGSPETAELRHDMMRVFSELKPQERALIWLAHVEGCGHGEIAEAVGVGEKSVKVLLFRARKKLAELLSKKGLHPGSAR